MYVGGVNASGKVDVKKKKGSIGASDDFSSVLGEGDEVTTVVEVPPSASLLSLQSPADDALGQHHALEYAGDLLDKLSKYRDAMLDSEEFDISAVKASLRKIDEASLEEGDLRNIIDEIELRVAVEEAKRSK